MSDFYSLPEKDESDAKAWFYLDHRADIETWASLRAEGVALLERYMLSLAPGMSELAAELNAEPYERDLEAGPWPLFGLTRPDWQFNGHQDIAIAVEWERRELLRGIQRPWPYVGVRVDPSHKDPERRAAVASAVARARPHSMAEVLAFGRYGRTSPLPRARGRWTPPPSPIRRGSVCVSCGNSSPLPWTNCTDEDAPRTRNACKRSCGP